MAQVRRCRGTEQGVDSWCGWRSGSILRSVVERMLQPNPASRPSAAELVQQVRSSTGEYLPCCLRKGLLTQLCVHA